MLKKVYIGFSLRHFRRLPTRKNRVVLRLFCGHSEVAELALNSYVVFAKSVKFCKNKPKSAQNFAVFATRTRFLQFFAFFKKNEEITKKITQK